MLKLSEKPELRAVIIRTLKNAIEDHKENLAQFRKIGGLNTVLEILRRDERNDIKEEIASLLLIYISEGKRF